LQVVWLAGRRGYRWFLKENKQAFQRMEGLVNEEAGSEWEVGDARRNFTPPTPPNSCHFRFGLEILEFKKSSASETKKARIAADLF
jgi:hypothetical protein